MGPIVKIDYEKGYALIQGAVNENEGTEFRSMDSMRERIYNAVKKDGREIERVLNETPHLIEWIERSTKKPFRRPFGEFVFRIVGEGIGKEPLSEWPK